jgi:mono/diheme cytochrome c family protein
MTVLPAVRVAVATEPDRPNSPPTPPAAVSWEKDIRPLFKAACFHCHGEEEKPKGGLDLRLARLAIKGGDSGAGVVPGKPAESDVLDKIRSGAMPPEGKKLTPDQVRLVERWIAEGAKTLRPEPTSPDAVTFTEEERSFWAFQPVRRPPVPTADAAGDKGVTPIDRFLLARLKAKGLGFSQEADRVTLIRRLSFDLLGLPPTPAEVEAFVADKSPDAWEKLVDRMLASPHYGVRQARHWLDVVGYAESDGVTVEDRPRAQAWRYRDYVVDSLNADVPFDRFLREQLAGDELIPAGMAKDHPEAVRLLTATGMLRMAPDGTAIVNDVTERNNVVAETLKVVGSAALGLSVGCAQCHNHRYDPISQADYYRLRAVFEPALDPKNWRQPDGRLVDVTPAATHAKRAELEKQAKAIDDAVVPRLREIRKLLIPIALKRVPEPRRAEVAAAVEVPLEKRSKEQVALLTEFREADVLTPERGLEGLLIEYDGRNGTKFDQEIKGRRGEARKIRESMPPLVQLAVLDERPGQPPVTHLFHRGDPQQPKQAVSPGEFGILALQRPSADLASKPTPQGGSGRRLAFADRLTDGKHPLVARVIVNRLWLNRFGRGLVNTPAEFGAFGERPSHPELLDWLADELVNPTIAGPDGKKTPWSLKRLHRLILTSMAWKQSAARTAKLEQLDPDNTLLGRANVRRLDAESVRDGILAVAGRLNPKLGGTSAPVCADFEGMATIGRRSSDVFVGAETIQPVGDEEFRRSLFVEARRKLPLPVLEAFDLPVMNPNCDLRRSTTVAPQSLLMLNNGFVVRESQAMAERLFKEEPADDARRVILAARLLFGSAPTGEESTELLAFLAAQKVELTKRNEQLPKERKIAPDRAALASLCQTLLCSNRFLYVE